MKNIYLTLVITVAANFALTSCSAFEDKQAFNEKQATPKPARVYSIDPNAARASNDDGSTKWIKVAEIKPGSGTLPGTVTPTGNIADIEPAAGPGATASQGAVPSSYAPVPSTY
jgi:hypothetical protein